MSVSVGEARASRHVRIVFAAALVMSVCAAGCDPGEPAQPRSVEIRVAPARDFTSGARLRARYQVIDGLVEVFTTFHDVEFGADCAYDDATGSAHVGPDASSYCLPAGMAGHRENRGPYSDAACTVRAAFTPPTGAGTYALIEARNACVTAPEVHLAGPPEMKIVFLKDDNGVCVRGGSPVSTQALIGAVPLGKFVRAVEQVERRAGRIGARVLVGDDGSRRVVGGFDRVRGEPSRVGLAPDGSRRWLPSRTAFVGGGELLFADAACGVPVATKIARTATCPLGAAVVLEGSCGSGSYFELGAPVSAVFARGTDDGCAAVSAADLLGFRLGAPIALSAYEPVVAVDIGTPAARRRGMAAAGDSPVTWGEVVAVTSNEPCEVIATADGSLRCLPAAVVDASLFADPTCITPAFARTSNGCETEDLRFVTASGESPRVFEVAEEVRALYVVEADLCAPFTPSFTSRGFALREVDVTRFPRAALIAD